MFGHNYTETMTESVNFTYIESFGNSSKGGLTKVCCTSHANICRDLAVGDVDFHDSKQILARF